MSNLKCRACGTTWNNGELRPLCPKCLAETWLSSPTMISPKHDPTLLPSSYDKFRSVVPNELLHQPKEYFQAIANSGTALWSNRDNKYCYVNGIPPYMTAGSAIPSGNTMPTRPMNAYLVADAFGSNPHIFAEDDAKIHSYIIDGKYEYLHACLVDGCNNSRLHGTDFCVMHTNPPNADEVKDE